MTVRLLFASLALFLSGCVNALTGGAGDGARATSYPSLARRPIERSDFDAVETPAPVTPQPDPALDAEIARLSAQVSEGSAVFDKAFADANRKVRSATGASISSDAWLEAQVAISALESARNASVSALASLDTLYAERIQAVAESKAQGGEDRVAAARAKALAAVDSQNDRVDALKAILPQA